MAMKMKTKPKDIEAVRRERRKFFKYAGATAGAIVLARSLSFDFAPLLEKPSQSAGQISFRDGLPIVKGDPSPDSLLIGQKPLLGSTIPKYVDPVPTFFDPITNTNLRVNAALHPALTVTNLEIQNQILPASIYAPLPAPFNAGSYVWAYQVSDTGTSAILGPANYPAFTIEAQRNTPVNATYVNSLPNPGSSVLQPYMTVDQTIHWADPLMVPMGSYLRRLPYLGPIPVVTHLHGGEVPSASDSGPDAWFTPGYGITGPAWTYGGVTQNYTYPNAQEATTLFYHDHCLGATRLNLYAGLVGFYLIRDAFDTGVPGTGLNLPAGPYETELAIQDKMFDTNGQLLFPDGFPSGPNGPPPNTDVHPYWNPEFFGDAIVVNGKTWPYMDVEPRRYRFRIVDGANARFFRLKLGTLPFWVIGGDGGLINKPAKVTQLFLAPGERADVIVDFAPAAGTNIIMTNNAKAPFPSGVAANPNTVGQIMQFRVGTVVTGGTDTSFNPAAAGAILRGSLAGRPPKMIRLTNSATGTLQPGVVLSKKRMLILKEIATDSGPLMVTLNNTHWDGLRPDGTQVGTVQLGPNWLNELPQVGSTEQWDIINLTMDAHPIHLHLVQFQLLNRQTYNQAAYLPVWNAAFPGGAFIPEYGPPLAYDTPNASGYVGGNPDVTPYLTGAIVLPGAFEAGWKDTVKMNPGEVARIVVRWAPQDKPITGAGAPTPGVNKYPFDPTIGPGYVWHCHIVDHEDNEMMRPYKVV
jgi:FtsP/CotA-like multicopper oxidase with cupredoxin domain